MFMLSAQVEDCVSQMGGYMLYLQTGRPTHLANTLRLCSLGKGSILRTSFIVLLLLWHSTVTHLIFWVGTKTSKFLSDDHDCEHAELAILDWSLGEL